MNIAERIAELRRIVEALSQGAGSDDVWSVGVVDMACRRIQAQIDSLLATDQELVDFSERYARNSQHPHVGITRPTLLAEIARRHTLSAHQRLAENAEREAME